MTLTGFSLPELSAFDPTVEVKEASTQMGLAAIPDRLADLLVPGLRARMKRVRFVTAKRGRGRWHARPSPTRAPQTVSPPVEPGSVD